MDLLTNILLRVSKTASSVRRSLPERFIDEYVGFIKNDAEDVEVLSSKYSVYSVERQ